jgi:hypothetical protein
MKYVYIAFKVVEYLRRVSDRTRRTNLERKSKSKSVKKTSTRVNKILLAMEKKTITTLLCKENLFFCSTRSKSSEYTHKSGRYESAMIYAWFRVNS